jgi:hypothetical protein
VLVLYFVVRERLGARDMDQPQLPIDAQGPFKVRDLGLVQLLFHLCHDRCALLSDLGIGLRHGGFAEGLLIQTGKQFCRPFQRDEMADFEIDRLRLQIRPVLDRLRDLRPETFPCRSRCTEDRS